MIKRIKKLEFGTPVITESGVKTRVLGYYKTKINLDANKIPWKYSEPIQYCHLENGERNIKAYKLKINPDKNFIAEKPKPKLGEYIMTRSELDQLTKMEINNAISGKYSETEIKNITKEKLILEYLEINKKPEKAKKPVKLTMGKFLQDIFTQEFRDLKSHAKISAELIDPEILPNGLKDFNLEKLEKRFLNIYKSWSGPKGESLNPKKNIIKIGLNGKYKLEKI